MHDPYYDAESLDELEVGTPEYGEIESTEAVTEDAVFGETEEMELAAELLEVTDEKELQGFMGNLISRATGGMLGLAASPHLRRLLCQAAKRVLPMVAGTAGARLATAAGDLFGLELEGLSPEDQEFEAARRFVRFAGAGARNAARIPRGVSPKVAARRALGAAARSQAPGFLRRRQPGPSTGVLGQAPGFPRWRQPGPSGDLLGQAPGFPRSRQPGPSGDVLGQAPGFPRWRQPGPSGDVLDQAPGFPRWRRPRLSGDVLGEPASTDYAFAPRIPIEVTCHCCGAQQTVAVPGTTVTDTTVPGTTGDGDHNTLPVNEPASSTEPQAQQTQTTEEITMHDIDRTTMETSDEADFEFSEAQDESGAESLFSEEEEAEHAARLFGINDEAELDQFLGDLLNVAKNVAKTSGFSLANLNWPLLGGFLKGAIKKALPIAPTGERIRAGIVPAGLMGHEYEALAPEDQEYEVAKRLVRIAGDAVQNAAQAPPTADPQAVAKSAVVAAAQAHMPALLQDPQQGAGSVHNHHPRSGRWYRRGRKILLVGV